MGTAAAAVGTVVAGGDAPSRKGPDSRGRVW